ncbi:MAG: hypothetical protein HYY00_00550 [Chloroflexi bacterium]|nr:hypothetical protein [Chloroflexota bacterium]
MDFQDGHHATCGSLPEEGQEVVRHFVRSVEEGRPWGQALLEAVATWTAPEEEFQGRHIRYLLQGEAFDWLALAERLCLEVNGVIPREELEHLLFCGELPGGLDERQFRQAVGSDKYRAHVNFYYGVEVEEALILAVEGEVAKEFCARGLEIPPGLEDLAYGRIYRRSQKELFREFCAERGRRVGHSMTLNQRKEFTYWLFKLRLRLWDGARVASDTRKGLLQLQRLGRLPSRFPSR